MQLLEIFEKGNYSEVIDFGIKCNYKLSQDPEAGYITAAAHFRLGNMQKACEICDLIGRSIFTQC